MEKPDDRRLKPVGGKPLPRLRSGAGWTPRSGPSRTEFFDHLAREHDAMAFTAADVARLPVLRERLGDLAGLRVLEPGCGAGHLTEQLAEWVGPAGRVVAVDPSAAMLERARARVAGAANVEFQQTRIEDVEFAAGAFDRIVCFRVWPHFETGDAVLARCARWLVPGGRLTIVFWTSRAQLAAIHREQAAVAGDIFPPRAELNAALRRHGFTVRKWIDDEREIFIAAAR
jgi:ubiquinone/menaquinone biosynthesis C-methylase UbiE